MKKTIFGLLSLTILLGLGTATNAQPIAERKGLEVSLTGAGDAFTLLENNYEANESFVYTADINFTSGQAGGLVFGAAQNEHYFVFNMDRYENKTKLMYFQVKPEGGYQVDELYTDYFIGNDKMNDQERNIVYPSVRERLTNVNMKVILTSEDDHTYVEFFLEGIKRFGTDTVIDLSNISGKDYSYQGGFLGINCFNSQIVVDDIEIGASDYSYMSEQYRNQFHLSPFAKWTNDPNGLVYYKGYYHFYYQTNPFGQLWGDMYWGHARSTDLIHWEFLPICLFPETETQFGPGNGYMWSGCAVAYYKGMSDTIDSYNWFPNGNGDGIYAIFTRAGGLQDQVIMSSDDDGMTWTKRIRVPQSLSGIGDHLVDYRDPKVFPLEKEGEKVTRWGMTLSSMNLSKGYFLMSTDLINWAAAGDFNFPRPECIGVGEISDGNGNTYHYLTNKSRTYLLGHLYYDINTSKIVFKDLNNVDVSTYSSEDMPLELLDFGPDTYASQSFYIGDASSEYYGKDIVVNWFSGDLNASFCTGPGEYANLRDGWNGGFTMPVEYTVKYIDGKPVLAQTPITLDNTNLEKEEIVKVTNQTISADKNLLENVHTNTFELKAEITTDGNTPIKFKVNASDTEYMEFGWNKTDGYYVDRSNHDSKGINTNIDYHTRYASHILGDSDTKTFYVLSDNGGLEVFCEDFKIPFYFVTIPTYSSNNASLEGTGLTVNSLEVNEIKTIWRKDIASGEGILRLSSDVVELDTTLSTSKYVSAYYTGTDTPTWELVSGEGIVNYSASNHVLKVDALNAGEATFKVVAGKNEETLNVVVYSGTFRSDFTFSKSNIKSGSWVMSEDSIIGENLTGNGFLLSNQSGADFTYSTRFNIIEGTAASLVFRSDLAMEHFLVLNYDRNERIVKLWNESGEITRSGKVEVNSDDVVLSVVAEGRHIEGLINGQRVLNHELADTLPLSGYFGLNVFAAKVEFQSLNLLKEEYEYNASGLQVRLDVEQNVKAIYNVTNKNTRVESGFYKVEGNIVTFLDDYFLTLKETGVYEFRIVGELSTFTIKVDVKSLPTKDYEDVTVDEGYDVTIYVGNINITSITVNGEALDASKYTKVGVNLRISKDAFSVGENEVVINGSITIKVTVNSINSVINIPVTKTTYVPLIVGSILGGLALVTAIIIVIFVIRKKKLNKE